MSLNILQIEFLNIMIYLLVSTNIWLFKRSSYHDLNLQLKYLKLQLKQYIQLKYVQRLSTRFHEKGGCSPNLSDI